jgi:hypothetical protein
VLTPPRPDQSKLVVIVLSHMSNPEWMPAFPAELERLKWPHGIVVRCPAGPTESDRPSVDDIDDYTAKKEQGECFCIKLAEKAADDRHAETDRPHHPEVKSPFQPVGTTGNW